MRRRVRVLRAVGVGVVLGVSVSVLGLGGLWLAERHYRDGLDVSPPIGTVEPPGFTVPPEVPRAAFEQRADVIEAGRPEAAVPYEGDGGTALLPVDEVFAFTPDPSMLYVGFRDGGCGGRSGPWLRETDHLVIVGAWSLPGPVPGAGTATDSGACAAEEAVGFAVLRTPLGDRPVIDAVTGRELRVAPQA
ncbi:MULTISPECIES: hypothetical protein [Streptomyces]|uniref:hypothetical protein n=1 Tax=Streptomyces TaxID=1883 RepID=UPI001319E959|nr:MULTISPECIES: hypothetical protein [Streptomyces]QKV68272.1 hypothetical protein HUT13_05395 [Streptomyces harbinensis]